MELKVSSEIERDNGIIGKELLKQLSMKGQLLDLFTGSTFANLLNVFESYDFIPDTPDLIFRR
jgi:hypothetical protein